MSEMQKEDVWRLFRLYDARSDFDSSLFAGFCGTEILRRTIGLAQVPLDATLDEKQALMDLATTLILTPEVHSL